MLAAFWSPRYHEETAEIATLVAGMCCRVFPCSVALAENFLHTCNLGFHLLGRRYDTIRNTFNRENIGNYMPGEVFLRHVCYETNRTSQFDMAVDVNGKGVSFLPMNQSLTEDVYRYGMSMIFGHKVDFLLEQYDNVFLNLEANGNDTTLECLERADAVIVCLPSSIEAFDQFYEQYRSLLSKCYFVFYSSVGVYDKPGRVLDHIQSLAAKYVTRCSFLLFTRLLQNYLAEGRGLDYVDRFYDAHSIEWSLPSDVAESIERYHALSDTEARGDNEYVNWKHESMRKISEVDIYAGDYPTYSDGSSERGLMRSLQETCEWMMKREYPDAKGDCAVIAERLLRRKFLPDEVRRWNTKKKRDTQSNE